MGDVHGLCVVQGKWTARKIPNPDYYEDLEPYKMTPIVRSLIILWIILFVIFVEIKHFQISKMACILCTVNGLVMFVTFSVVKCLSTALWMQVQVIAWKDLSPKVPVVCPPRHSILLSLPAVLFYNRHYSSFAYSCSLHSLKFVSLWQHYNQNLFIECAKF